jgi:hypothetical protein
MLALLAWHGACSLWPIRLAAQWHQRESDVARIGFFDWRHIVDHSEHFRRTPSASVGSWPE